MHPATHSRSSQHPNVTCHIPSLARNRDLPFDVRICTPARNTVNNTRIRALISRRLITKMANTPLRKASRHADSPKIQYLAVLRRTSTIDLP